MPAGGGGGGPILGAKRKKPKKPKKAQIFSADLLKMWPWGEPEFRFNIDRRWRFDWADGVNGIAVELDGYQYHTVRSRWLEDMEKMTEALISGWKVLHITPDQFRNGEADALLRRLYETIHGKYPRDEVRDETA